MTTRCHILFRDKDYSLLTYKHSDGYPEGIIPLLREFWEWCPLKRNLEYLTATWCYFCKRRREKQSAELERYGAPMATSELAGNHPVSLSVGICAGGETHGDAEHLYEVNIEEETVAHYILDVGIFEEVKSPSNIVSQEPHEGYQLTTSKDGDEQSKVNSPFDSNPK